MRSVVGAYALLFTLGSIVYLKLPLLEVDAGRFLDIRANFGCLRAVFVKYDFQPEELYKRLPHFLDKCMRRNWDGWLEHFEADGRSAAFVRLPAPLSHVPPAPSYLHDSRQCSIVHVTNHTGIALEAAMKEAHPECDVVKVDQHVVDTDPSQELRVRVVNSAFSVSRRRRVSAVDHYALTSMILATRHIDALYVDESVPPVDFADILDSIGHLQQFPVCQMTLTSRPPANDEEQTNFAKFVDRVVLRGIYVPILARHSASKDLLMTTLVNQYHPFCYRRIFALRQGL